MSESIDPTAPPPPDIALPITPESFAGTPGPAAVHVGHLAVLDGWRGISIVFVLLAHLAPLGWVGNVSVGIAGMAVFFALSGFLITSFLLEEGATLRVFLIRRFMRVVPLVWLYLGIVFSFQTESVASMAAHFLFYANLPEAHVRLATDHLWSICVEVQFYMAIALLFFAFRVRGLYVLPLVGLAVTALRVWNGAHASSITWFRIDEILAGCALALLYRGGYGNVGKRILQGLTKVPQWLLVLLFVVSCRYENAEGNWLNYLRPYLCVLLIGATLCNPRGWLHHLLRQRLLVHLATISYALYVIHAGLALTWLGGGDRVEKYAKRPLLLVVLYVLARASTTWYERPFIALGKRLSRRLAVK